MILTIRAAQPSDAQHITDIDIKCFDHPWPTEYWATEGQDFAVSVATSCGTPIGMAIYGVMPDGGVALFKLGVKPTFRRTGRGRLLFMQCYEFARQCRATYIQIVVPENLCEPGPNCVAGWLTKLGFRATRPLIERVFDDCGYTADGIRFVCNMR